jgi:orotate phosphoribosyltransferase
MEQVREKVITWLFETGAMKVCPENKPFWYTSAKIGPYYINTHFLYGSEEKASDLLGVIDKEKDNRLGCTDIIYNLVRSNYDSDAIYRGLIDQMVEYIKRNMDINEIDYISGGERRDWFFSILTAAFLKKPHVTIFKDMSAVLFNGRESVGLSNIKEINGKASFLHIADIITEASSYTRAWVPAVKSLGGVITTSMVVVDRLQGGAQNLTAAGVKSHTLVEVDKEMFDTALLLGHINTEQHRMLIDYTADPTGTMKKFLSAHPEFIESSLASTDAKTRERARICVDKNIYGI